MFLDLSFASSSDEKMKSKSSSSWDFDLEEKQEMSVEELISDFHKSAPSRFKRNAEKSLPSSPKKSKPIEKGGGTGCIRAAKPKPVKTKPSQASIRKTKRDGASDDDSAVSPVPRIDHALRNKPSILGRHRTARASALPRFSSIQRRKPQAKSPVLSSPPSLSPATSLSISFSDKKHEPMTSDSVDTLIRNDIRELHELIATSSRMKSHDAAKLATRSNKPPNVSSKVNDLRPSLRVQVQKTRSREPALESPRPPPPPPAELDDETEDSFAEEIQKLRASWRRNSLPVHGSERKPTNRDETIKTPVDSVVAATTVRHASNTIHELLLEAFKPFENRLQEKRDESQKDEKVVEIPETVELQAATQTIVSQLDMAFADMVARQKADVKAEKEATIAANEAAAKEKKIAEKKKDMEEKEAKVREMQILALLPMHGKLLTCSTDIDSVLEQLESVDLGLQSEGALDAEMLALRNHTHLKMQEIDARMVADVATKDKNEEISPKMTGTKQDKLNLTRPEVCECSSVEAEPASFENVLQQQVLEKLDLTILRLRHVLGIDAKEAAEVKETEERERKEQEEKKLLQQKADEQEECDLKDAESARRRVLGLTRIDDVEDWIDEGRRLEDEFGYDRPLNRLLASMENCMGRANDTDLSSFISNILPYEGVHQCNQSIAARKSQVLLEKEPVECNIDEGKGCEERLGRHHRGTKRLHHLGQSGGPSCADGGSDSDESSYSVGFKCEHRSKRGGDHWTPVTSPQRLFKVPNSFNRRDETDIPDDGERVWSQAKSRKQKQGVMGSQREINRTIQALQAERRQKSTWIRSRKHLT